MNQIKAEIARLKEIQPRVRRFSNFGDDHHAAIDAQLRALEEGWDENDCWDAWPEEEFQESNERTAAMDAVWWMREQNNAEAPSKSWRELAAPKKAKPKTKPTKKAKLKAKPRRAAKKVEAKR